jgi:AcrR family transcriptional regulator
MVKVRPVDKTDSPLPGQPTRGLRADAARNRDAVIAAAREAFVSDGLSTPLSEIARRAGIGTATLFRRFPSRESLIAEVLEAQLASCLRVADEAIADENPQRAFVTLVSKLCMLQAEDRACTLALMRAAPDTGSSDQARERMEQAIRLTVTRAQAAGQLREEVHWADVVLLLSANAGLGSALHKDFDTRQAGRRLTALVLDAFGVRPEHATLPPRAEMGLGSLR